MILSGMLLPLETGPGWMRVAANFNPLAHMVTAERLLFAGNIAETAVAWGFVAARQRWSACGPASTECATPPDPAPRRYSPMALNSAPTSAWDR